MIMFTSVINESEGNLILIKRRIKDKCSVSGALFLIQENLFVPIKIVFTDFLLNVSRQL
jgi:hypothetical protein